MTVAALPRIVRYLGRDDCPDSSCPHCGATGRFILRFLVEDGRTLGAMRGCAALFPQSRIATEELRLRKKQTDCARNGGRLNRDDAEALASIDQFYAGALDEQSALARVDSAKRANQMRYRR